MLAGTLHAAASVALFQLNDSPDIVATAPAIIIELAPVPVAPKLPPAAMPPEVQQAEAKPDHEPKKPIDKIETKLEVAKEAELPAATIAPEKSRQARPDNKHQRIASAPSVVEERRKHAMAPAPGSTSQISNALPSWKSALVARLERYKRYPPEAQQRGEQGVAQLAFSVDRNGHVHRARIVHSSGSRVLDRETLALAERASPMPPPPAELSGAQIPIVVPIRYSVR